MLRVEAALQEAGVSQSDVVHTPESARTAEEAAAAVGTSVSQIVKSLIFLCDGAPVIALVSGSNRLDTKALGALAGGRIERADANAARDAWLRDRRDPADRPSGADPDLDRPRPARLRCRVGRGDRPTRSFRSRRTTSSGPATGSSPTSRPIERELAALATPRRSSRMPKVMPQITSSLPPITGR